MLNTSHFSRAKLLQFARLIIKIRQYFFQYFFLKKKQWGYKPGYVAAHMALPLAIYLSDTLL